MQSIVCVNVWSGHTVELAISTGTITMAQTASAAAAATAFDAANGSWQLLDVHENMLLALHSSPNRPHALCVACLPEHTFLAPHHNEQQQQQQQQINFDGDGQQQNAMPKMPITDAVLIDEPGACAIKRLPAREWSWKRMEFEREGGRHCGNLGKKEGTKKEHGITI